MLLHDKLWTFRKGSNKNARKFAKNLGISSVTARLLLNRGIQDIEEARTYLEPNIEKLYNPFLMKDMDIAVNRIKKAIDLGEDLWIYGSDYIDATSCIAILYKYFKSVDCNISYYINDEDNDEFITFQSSINSIKSKNADLIIFVDCGITSNDSIKYVSSLGIDSIVIDDRDNLDLLKDAIATLNPKRNDCNYPYSMLSCVGIGLKLIQGLLDQERLYSQISRYLDIVVLGTIAENAPLTGENRILVKNGLKILNEAKDNGLKALIEKFTLENERIKAEDVTGLVSAFTADGKIYSPSVITNLLLSDNYIMADDISDELINTMNKNKHRDGIYPHNEKISITSTDNISEKRDIIEIDMELGIKDVGFNLVEEIRLLEPFGDGNEKPVFSFRKIAVEGVDFVGEDEEHLMLLVQEGNRVFDCIGLDLGNKDLKSLAKERIDLAFNLETSIFKGIETLQFNIKDLRRRNEKCYKERKLVEEFYQSFPRKNISLRYENENMVVENVKDLRNTKDRAKHIIKNIDSMESNLILINTVEGLIDLTLSLSDTENFEVINSIGFNTPKDSKNSIVVNPNFEEFDLNKYENIFVYDIPLLREEIDIILDCENNVYLLYNKDDCKALFEFIESSIPKRDDLAKLYKYFRKFTGESQIAIRDLIKDLDNINFSKLRFCLEILADAGLLKFNLADENLDIKLLGTPEKKLDITATQRYREITIMKEHFKNYSKEAFVRKFK